MSSSKIYEIPSNEEFEEMLAGYLKLFKNFKAGKLKESDKELMRLSDNFLELTNNKEGNLTTEVRWHVMKNLQGKPIGRFKPDCVAEYMRKVYDGDNDQSHPGYKMDKRFKAYLANSVKKEFDKTDFKIHFKNL